MEILFNGLKFGIVLAFLIGPVFFTIIQTSIERGFWNGILVSFGVSLSDIMYVTICYFGLIQFINEPTFKLYLGYIGGGILIAFGLYHLFIKSRKNLQAATQVVAEKKMYRYIVKGFVINGLSPMVLIFWIGSISVASLDFGYTRGFEFFLFFCAVLITVLATDILKAYLADKLRRLITQRLMMIINIIVGLCLIGFGLKLLFVSDSFL